MKSIWQRTSLWIMAIIALVTLVPASVFAVAGTVYFGPDGDTVTNGSEFYVEVRGNVPDPGGFWGGGGTIRFTYDPTKLQFISADDSGGVFRQNNNHNWNTESGAVYYRAQIYFNAPGVNNQKIIGARFKAIGTGPTTLSFSPSTNVNDGPTTGTPKTFTILPVACPAGQVGTPPNCATPPPPTSPSPTPTRTPTPSRTPTPQPTPTPTPEPVPTPTTEVTPEPTTDNDGGLKVQNVKTIISRQKNSITWSMSQSGLKPELTHGPTKGNLKNKATVNMLSDGSYEATLEDIKPGTLNHFAIKASTEDQLKSANYNGSFTSKGYPVQITVKQNGILAPGSKIEVNDRSFVSDKNATMTAEFGEGTYEATVTPKASASSYKANIVVKKVTIPQSGEPQTQNLTLDGTIEGASEATGDNPLPLVLGIIAGATGIGGLAAFMLYKKRRNDSSADTFVDSDLLITNYGNAIDDSRAQTPEPNLEVRTSPPVIEQPQATQSAYDQPFVEEQITSYDNQPVLPSQYATPEPSPIDETTYDTPYRPVGNESALDSSDQVLSPQYNAPVADAQDAVPELAPQLDEQLSEQVVAVESIDNDVEKSSDFEEAIYHPETGELDIIHNSHPPSVAPQAQGVVEYQSDSPPLVEYSDTAAAMSKLGKEELQIRTVTS